MSFSIIAAIGKNRELGKKGGLVFNIPGDLRFFKQTTMGYPVVMGRTTFLSLPRLLPGRKHYVLSPDEEPTFPEEVTVLHDLNQFIKDHQNDSQEFFIIGGGSIYQQSLPYCDKIYLTEVDGEDTEADVYFPDFDKSKYTVTKLGQNSDIIEDKEGIHDLNYIHNLYQKRS